MPTYNDSQTISEALDSIKSQTYDNYEVLICNDGSTDDTEQIVKNYIKSNDLEEKFIYLRQENSDQLNALKKAFSLSDGDYIYILHSDDVFDDSDVLRKLVEDCKKNPHIEAFMPSEIPVIDKTSKYVRVMKIRNYNRRRNYIKELLLSGGSQLFVDMALFKRDAFQNDVFYNYLTWNRPFWANIEQKRCLDVKRLEYPTFKYRIFENNYVASELGLICHYNGVIRTLIDASEYYFLPFYNVQKFLYKCFNRLKWYKLINVVACDKKTKNKVRLLTKNLPKELWNYSYYCAILNFYKNCDMDRCLDLSNIPDNVFLGSDMRKFNKLMLKNELPEFYVNFMKEMDLGFNKITCKKTDRKKIDELLHFFCIKNVLIDEK